MVIGIVAVALLATMPAWAQQGKGRGKPGGSNTVMARQVTIDDDLSAQLESDGMMRDGSGALVAAPQNAAVVYQDHRLTFMDAMSMPTAPYPDPCVGTNDNQFDFDRGADPNQTNCNIAPGFEGHGRTFTLIFLPAEPQDEADPVHEVCNQFAFVAETAPGPVWGAAYEVWGTTFEWNGPDDPEDPGYRMQGCRVTPSTGGIVTDLDSTQLTANAQLYGDPFAEPKRGKKGGGGSGMSLNINFRVDRQYPGEPNQWQVKSQEANLEVTVDENDPDVRIVTATDQLFDLCRGSTCVEGFQLPLRIVYRRYEVIVQ
jgi:hypothetical protein